VCVRSRVGPRVPIGRDAHSFLLDGFHARTGNSSPLPGPYKSPGWNLQAPRNLISHRGKILVPYFAVIGTSFACSRSAAGSLRSAIVGLERQVCDGQSDRNGSRSVEATERPLICGHSRRWLLCASSSQVCLSSRTPRRVARPSRPARASEEHHLWTAGDRSVPASTFKPSPIDSSPEHQDGPVRTRR